MAKRDVNVDRLAEAVGEEFFEALRGVLCFDDGDLLLFGNDGYTLDERARREARQVEAALLKRGFLVKGFGLCPQGYSWALLVAPPAAKGEDELDRDFAAVKARELAERLLWAAAGRYRRVDADQVPSRANTPRPPCRWRMPSGTSNLRSEGDADR
jgi:hypothetical protein